MLRKTRGHHLIGFEQRNGKSLLDIEMMQILRRKHQNIIMSVTSNHTWVDDA
jgi:hypothetical protein